MPPVIIAGIILVHLALIFYVLFIINEHLKRKASFTVLIFITLAVIFDLSATACMMAGTSRTYFTFHGMMGYAGLLLMIIDTVLLWRYKIINGTGVLLSKKLNAFSKAAFLWWITAYFTGIVVALGTSR